MLHCKLVTVPTAGHGLCFTVHMQTPPLSSPHTALHLITPLPPSKQAQRVLPPPTAHLSPTFISRPSRVPQLLPLIE